MSDDKDFENFCGLVTTVAEGLSSCMRDYNASVNRYYDSVDKYYQLSYLDAEDKRKHKRKKAKERNRHEEEMARIEAEKKKKENEHAQEMARIEAEKTVLMARVQATKELREQENQLRMRLLKIARQSYASKIKYYHALRQDAQAYFIPMRDKLLEQIGQLQKTLTCGVSSIPGDVYDAIITEMGHLRTSLNKCTSDYDDLMFKLAREISNVKLEIPAVKLGKYSNGKFLDANVKMIEDNN